MYISEKNSQYAGSSITPNNYFAFFPIVGIMIVGSTIHFLIAYTVGKKHSLALTAQTKRIQDQLDEEERLRNEQHEREKDQGSTSYIIFLHGAL